MVRTVVPPDLACITETDDRGVLGAVIVDPSSVGNDSPAVFFGNDGHFLGASADDRDLDSLMVLCELDTPWTEPAPKRIDVQLKLNIPDEARYKYATSRISITDSYGRSGGSFNVWPAGGGQQTVIRVFPDAASVWLEVSVVDLGRYRDEVLEGSIQLDEGFEGDRGAISREHIVLGEYLLPPLDGSCSDLPVLSLDLESGDFENRPSGSVIRVDPGQGVDGCPDGPAIAPEPPDIPEGLFAGSVTLTVDESFASFDSAVVIGVAIAADGGGVEVPLRVSAGNSDSYEGFLVAPGTRIGLFESIADYEPSAYLDLPTMPKGATRLVIDVGPGAVAASPDSIVFHPGKIVARWE